VRGDKFILEKLWYRVKELIPFSRGKLVMKIKKIHLHHLKLRNFMRIQKLKKMKNNSLRFLKLHIMNLKML